MLKTARPILLAAAAAAFAAVPLAAPLGSPALAQKKRGNNVEREVASFYAARGGQLIWLSPSAGNAAQELLQLLAT